MIPKSTARLAMTIALLGSLWAFFREYLRWQQTATISWINIGLAFVVPAALWWVIRVNSE